MVLWASHELRPGLSGYFFWFLSCCLGHLCNLEWGLECPKCLVWCLGRLEFQFLFLFFSLCVSVFLSLSFWAFSIEWPNCKTEHSKKNKLQYAGVFQASAGITLANVLFFFFFTLANVLLAKPKFVWGGGAGWICECWDVKFIRAK